MERDVPELFVEVFGQEGVESVLGRRNSIGREVLVGVLVRSIQHDLRVEDTRLALSTAREDVHFGSWAARSAEGRREARSEEAHTKTAPAKPAAWPSRAQTRSESSNSE